MAEKIKLNRQNINSDTSQVSRIDIENQRIEELLNKKNLSSSNTSNSNTNIEINIPENYSNPYGSTNSEIEVEEYLNNFDSGNAGPSNREVFKDKGQDISDSQFNNKYESKKKKPKKNKPKSKRQEKKARKEAERYAGLTADEVLELRINRLRIKKKATSICIIALFVFVMIFGIFNTFIRPQKSGQELASEVNYANRDTPFPISGVENYLKENVRDLMKDNISFKDGTKDFTIATDKLQITYIGKKTHEIANVYFTCPIMTEQGMASHNFVLPLKYDWNKFAYQPAGPIQFSIAQSQNSTKEASNDYLSFKGIEPLNDSDTDSAQVFLNNFFVMCYNEQKTDITQLYRGADKLGDSGCTYDKITDFKIYKGKNKNGYNARVEYTVGMTEGINFKVVSYLDMQKYGKSWVINNIL